MDKFFVKYLNNITNNLSSSLIFIRILFGTVFRISIKNCTSIKNIGGAYLFHKRKKLKEN